MTLTGLLVFGAWLRFYDLAHKSLFSDEVITINNSLAYSLQNVFPYELTHRSVLYLSTHYVIQTLGVNEYSIRLIPAVLGTLGVGAVYLLGRTFFDRPTALVATLLLAVSTFHIDHSQFARFYPGLLLFSVIAMVALARGVETNRPYYWLIFILATTLNLYNHLFAVLVLGAGAIWAIGILVARYWYSADSASRRATFRRFALLVVSGLLIVLLYLPALGNLSRTLSGVGEVSIATIADEGEEGDLEEGTGEQSDATGPATTGFNFATEFNQVLFQFRVGSDLTLVFHGSLFALGLGFMLIRRRWQPMTLFLLTGVVSFAFLNVVTTEHFFLPKYVIYLLPLYFLTMAYGMTSASKFVATIINRYLWPNRLAIPLLAITFVLLMLTPEAAISSWELPGYYGFHRATDARGTAHFVNNHADPGDGVVLLSGARGLGYRFYHAQIRDEGIHADHRQVHQLGSIEEADRYMSRYERLWIIADFRSLTVTDPDLYHWVVQNSFIVPFNGYYVYLKQEDLQDLTLDDRIAMLEDAWRLSQGTYNDDIPLELGDLLLARGEWKHAVDKYTISYKERPDMIGAERALASLYESRGDWSRARAVYSRLSQRWPSDPSYQVLEGKTFVQLGQPAEAEAAFREGSIVAGSPALELLERGNVALILGNYAHAVELFQQATQLEPNNQQAWINLARAYLLAGNDDAAERAYQEAIRVSTFRPIDPFQMADLDQSSEFFQFLRFYVTVDESNVALDLAQVEVLRGRYGAATLLAERALEVALVSPRDERVGVHVRHRPQVPFIVIRANLMLGDIATAAGDRESAEAYYLEAAAWDPFDPVPVMRIAQLHSQEQEFEDALTIYQQALTLAPGSPDVLGRVANTYQQLGKPEEAIEEYRQILEITPDDAQTRLLLADALYGIGEVDAAEIEYQTLVEEAESRPAFPEFAIGSGSPSIEADLLTYAEAFAGLGDIVRDRAIEQSKPLDYAIRLYDRGLTFNPEEARLLVGRAKAYQEARRLGRALADLELVASLDSESNLVLLDIGQLLYQSGQVDEAEATFRKAIEATPDLYPAHIQLGNLFLQIDQFDEAEKVFRDAINLDPDRAAAYRLLGDMYARLDNDTEAQSFYEQALERDPSHVSSMIALGDLLQETGDTTSARYWYLKANEVAPDSDQVTRRLQQTS